MDLESPFLLGGLAGYGDVHFRTLCRRFGAAAVVTPLHLDQALIAFRRKKPDRLPAPGEAERPVFGQILGRTVKEMTKGARIMEACGFDAVDVNLACPVPKVVKRGRGGAFLADPSGALAILEAVREAVSVPVTCKLRRGIDDSLDSKRAFLRIVEGIFEIPLNGITLHPRTVEQRYRGASDWGVLAELKTAFPNLVVVGSGDLFEAADGLRMIEETGVDGVAFARGAVGDPWIFREAVALWSGTPLQAPPPPVRAAWIAEYAERLFAAHREKRAVTRLRKHGVKAARRSARPRYFRSLFAGIESRGEAEEVLRRFTAAERTPEEE
jgi:nifR3 family TIM-barrel protein